MRGRWFLRVTLASISVGAAFGAAECRGQGQTATVLSPDLFNKPGVNRAYASVVPRLPVIPPWAQVRHQIYVQQPIYYGAVRVGPDYWHPWVARTQAALRPR